MPNLFWEWKGWTCKERGKKWTKAGFQHSFSIVPLGLCGCFFHGWTCDVPKQHQWVAPVGPTLLSGKCEGLCGGQWSTLPKQGIQPWTKGSPRVPCSCWGLALRKETKGLVATALAALTNIVGWESSAKLDNLINVSWFFSQAWILRTLPPAFAQFS